MEYSAATIDGVAFPLCAYTGHRYRKTSYVSIGGLLLYTFSRIGSQVAIMSAVWSNIARGYFR